MPAVVTPGIDLIARMLGLFVIVLGLVLASVKVAATRAGYKTPIWIALAGPAFGLPALVAIHIVSLEVSKRRQAASIGARIVPQTQGKLIGNLDILTEMMANLKSGYPGDALDTILKERGPVVNLRLLWSDVVITASPEHIKTILATDFHNYVKGERFYSSMESVLGTGVFNSDGEMWRFHRSITRPIFTREKISDFELFDRQASQVINKLRERLHQGYAVDFQDLMSRFTLDSATEFLFGHCVESLSAGLPYPHNATHAPINPRTSRDDAANDFARAFLQAQEAISLRERSGWVWPFMEILKDKTSEPMKVVNAYIEPIIKEALEKKRNTPAREKGEISERTDDGTLLDHLVQVTSDPRVLKDETLNIMIAIHPKVTARLREEILEKVGDRRRPDYDDIRDMKYLRAVINETLRLYPIVPFNVRETVNATTWISEDPNEKPYFIPAGTKVAYSVFIMQRRQDLWGPDVEEFDPDRFLDERLKEYLLKDPFIFLPFNAGPRICLGQQFAYNEMSFMLIRLLQNFSSIELNADAIPLEARPPAEWAKASGRKAVEKVFPKMHLTMYTYGGLWVNMKESDETN